MARGALRGQRSRRDGAECACGAGWGEQLDGWGRVESRWTGQTARARRVIRRASLAAVMGCACRARRISERGQAARVSNVRVRPDIQILVIP